MNPESEIHFWNMVAESWKELSNWCDREIKKGNDIPWHTQKRRFISTQIESANKQISFYTNQLKQIA